MYLTVFSDNIKEISFNKTIIELNDGRMIKMPQKICFVGCINCLIWLQIPDENFLCHFSSRYTYTKSQYQLNVTKPSNMHSVAHTAQICRVAQIKRATPHFPEYLKN